MKTLLTIKTAIAFFMLGCATLFAGCSKDDYKNDNAENPIVEPNGKTLVVYFSKTLPEGVDGTSGATQVFDNQGATQYIANRIVENIDADIHRITVADGYYPNEYQAVADFAKEEKESGTHPALTSKLDNLADYQNIIIGFPIWWYTMPMPVYSFFDEYDLSGKNIMIFTTHEGSGLGGSPETIRGLEPDANVSSDGFSSRGSAAGNQDDAIKEWVKKLGY